MVDIKKDVFPCAKDLEELFLSVEWASGKFPDKLETAMKNCPTVITAWEGDKLVGLANALDDGVMTAYVHFVLVRPEYQSKGIGRKLMEAIKEKYQDFLKIILVAYNPKIPFYNVCGFETDSIATPMVITSLED